jgi:ribosome maturation factor RimP
MIEPIIEALGFDLVQVRLMGGDQKTLQIMAERPDGSMTVDDCAEISRAISALLDVEDPLSGAYQLEVSSPGIARPLVRPRDFERFSGHLAKIELKEPIEGRKRFKGILDGLEEDHILLAVEGERDENDQEMVLCLPLELIELARLVMTDELLAEAQKT